MLKISNLRFEVLKEVILSDFNLNLSRQKVLTLFGPSGCGKSTLLRLIAGIERPKSGKIESKFKKIGILFQDNRLLPNLTAFENISVFADGANSDEIYAHALNLGFEKIDLIKYPHELSGGMQKRVAFLRLILARPDLALLDEPFVGLDRDLREKLCEILTSQISRGMSAILVTHDRFEAARLSHEIWQLTPKKMQIVRKISLPTPLQNRDASFEESVVKREFKGIIYYE